MMAETPTKNIHCEYKCFLCDVLVQSSSGSIKFFGKSAIDLPYLIQSAIGENIDKYHNCGSELFICNDKCYNRLQRFEKTRIEKASKKKSVRFMSP